MFLQRQYGFHGMLMIMSVLLVVLAACGAQSEQAGSNGGEEHEESHAESGVGRDENGANPNHNAPDISDEDESDIEAGEDPSGSRSEVDEASLAAQVRALSVEEKIGQMVMIGVSGTEWNDSMREMMHQYDVGGVILFADNVVDGQQTAKLIRDLKQNNAGAFPLLVGIDEEGGTVSRLPAEVERAPTARTVGATGDPALAYALGEAIGQILYDLGWNVNFAPVLDVDSNPDNPVIGERAYAADPQQVSRMGVPFMQGLQAANVIAVSKHFPGHGDTSVDSHEQLPLVTHSESRLVEVELAPFVDAIQHGADAIMIGHLLVSAFDADEPATFSAPIITDLLRTELEFDGVVFTDDLTMGAVEQFYTIGEAAVKAVAAGVDIVMIAHDKEKQMQAITALRQAVQSGEITEARLDESVMRIARLKQSYELDDQGGGKLNIERRNERMREVLQHVE